MEFSKQKKWILIIGACLCIPLMAMFVSCRLVEPQQEIIPDPENQDAEIGEGLPADPDRRGRISLSLWDCLEAKERLALMESVDAFMDMHPEIHMEVRHIRSEEELLDQFEAASLAGAGPDMAVVDLVSVQRMAESNVIKEIEDMDYIRFLPGLAETSVYNGNNYMVPFRATDFLTFYYNQDFVESAPLDFETVIEYSQDLNDLDEPAYGFVLNKTEPDWIIPFVGGYSTWIVDYTNYSISLDTQAMEKTLDFLYMLYDPLDPVITQDMDYEEMHTLFASGNIHMMINSFKVREQYLAEGINLGASVIPEVYGEGKNPTPLISGKGMMINANSFGEELQAAKEFIEFMLSVDQQVKWTQDTDTFPAVVEAGESNYFRNNELLSNMLSQAELCRGVPPDSVMRVVRDAIRINVPKAITGEWPVEEAARKIQEDAIRLRAGSTTIEDLREESLQQQGGE